MSIGQFFLVIEPRLEKINLTVFTHLQVTAKVDRIGNDSVRPCGKIHVAHWPTRMYEASQHL
jgi:hypothetical protein